MQRPLFLIFSYSSKVLKSVQIQSFYSDAINDVQDGCGIVDNENGILLALFII